MTNYTDEDAASVAKFLASIPGLPSISEQSFRAYAAQSFNGGARDFRIFRIDGRVIALLISTRLPMPAPPRRHFRILVHPDHRGKGWGRRCMQVLQEQATRPDEVVQCNSQKSWGPCNAFLEHFAFEVEARELLMRLTPERVLSGPRPGDEGLVIRPACDADNEAWSRLHTEAYGERDDFSALTPGDQVEERSSPGFALWIAEQQGQIAGYCHVTHLDSSEGLVNSLVVREEMQGQGIARHLLAAGNRGLWQSGVKSISLNVMEENAAAIHIYQAAGYQTYDELLRYQRSFAGPPP